MSSTKQLLLKTRELISNGWGRNYFFTDRNGLCVPVEQAECYCIVGAAGVACGEKPTHMLGIADGPTKELLSALYPHLPVGYRWSSNPRRCLTTFNDHPATTQQDVLAVIDKAIQAEAPNG
jgi:hypothetical protein